MSWQLPRIDLAKPPEPLMTPSREPYTPLVNPPIPCDFIRGDKVTYTNDYGVEWKGLRVIGFSDTVQNGRFIHLDMDCHWVPVKADRLKLEQKARIWTKTPPYNKIVHDRRKNRSAGKFMPKWLFLIDAPRT